MKKTVAIVSAIVFALLASGCMGKSIVVPQNQPISEPMSKVVDGIEIDWNQINSDCVALLDKSEYPYGKKIDFIMDPDAGMVGLAWMVDDACTYEDAPAYAEGFIKAFNDAMATQDFKYAISGENYYGGVFDIYGCEVYVFHEADQDNPEKYLVAQVVAPGSNEPIVPNK